MHAQIQHPKDIKSSLSIDTSERETFLWQLCIGGHINMEYNYFFIAHCHNKSLATIQALHRLLRKATTAVSQINTSNKRSNTCMYVFMYVCVYVCTCIYFRSRSRCMQNKIPSSSFLSLFTRRSSEFILSTACACSLTHVYCTNIKHKRWTPSWYLPLYRETGLSIYIETWFFGTVIRTHMHTNSH